MKAHMAKFHPESPLGQQKQGQQKQKQPIPQSWRKLHVHVAGLGWFCGNPDCFENLGFWEKKNEDRFNNHSCSLWAFPEDEDSELDSPETGRPFSNPIATLQARLKRSSLEEKKTRAMQAEEDEEETSPYDESILGGGKMHSAF
jgi:hypothetical protein